MLIKKLIYWLTNSYRRQKIDKELKKITPLLKGKILDIGGGRKRGIFDIPLNTNVLTVDINKNFNPDVVASVEKLPFADNSFEVVKATELFEHVENPEKGIKECLRVLKPKGYFIFSMPFLYPIHADPYDFQRWTKSKIEKILAKYSVKIRKFKIQGYYFSVLADFIKEPITRLPLILRWCLYLIIVPLNFLLLYLDKKISRNNSFLKKYHSGYFVICQKK